MQGARHERLIRAALRRIHRLIIHIKKRYRTKKRKDLKEKVFKMMREVSLPVDRKKEDSTDDGCDQDSSNS